MRDRTDVRRLGPRQGGRMAWWWWVTLASGVAACGEPAGTRSVPASSGGPGLVLLTRIATQVWCSRCTSDRIPVCRTTGTAACAPGAFPPAATCAELRPGTPRAPRTYRYPERGGGCGDMTPRTGGSVRAGRQDVDWLGRDAELRFLHWGDCFLGRLGEPGGLGNSRGERVRPHSIQQRRQRHRRHLDEGLVRLKRAVRRPARS